MITVIQVILIVSGLFVLLKGSDLVINGAVGIADSFRISPLVIGLTVVAIGTSAPEAAVSIMGVWKGTSSIAIGNIIGSNITNILLVLGLSAMITTLKVSDSTVRIEVPYMIFVSVLFLAFSYGGGSISKAEGIVFCICFLIYIGYVFWRGKNGDQKREVSAIVEHQVESSATQDKKLGKAFIEIVFGLVLVWVSSEMVVNSATTLAKSVGLTNRLIGLTVVALATSAPELITTVIAVRKRKAELAIGTIVGSNIFNLLFVISAVAFLRPISFDMEFLADIFVSIGAGVLLWLFTVRKKELSQKAGFVMMLAYVAYVMFRVAA